jgi:endogenous inhibitor of DNA gyrase (YacG/DUF329 family)
VSAIWQAMERSGVKCPEAGHDVGNVESPWWPNCSPSAKMFITVS